MTSGMLLNAGKGEMGKEFEHSDLSGAIIGAAIEVHRVLGPGFLESIYEHSLCVELEHLGLRCERQKVVPVFYRERLVGEHRLDVLVEGKIIVELKAVKTIEPIHFSVVRSYLKALALYSALVFNFSATPLTIRRIDLE